MDEPLIPWTRVKAFVRQHTHDIRNDINSLDLETALLQDLVPPGEPRAGVERMQKQLRGLARQLRLLSAHFQSVDLTPTPLPSKVLFSIWREQYAALANPPPVEWMDESGETEVNLDVEMLADVFRELLANAAAYGKGGKLTISAKVQKPALILELRQASATTLDPQAWAAPFCSMRRNSYGLGLSTVRRLVDANKGTFTQIFDAEKGELVTQITLPLAG